MSQHRAPIAMRFARALGLLLGVLGLCSAHALDPDRRFHHYVKETWSIDEGLPQISALALAQDHAGYLWIGTQAGLARFDGVKFTVFGTEDTPALPGAWVPSLLVDSGGTLWVGTYKGLARYSQLRFETIAGPDSDVVLEIRALAETADGRVLAATGTGVFEVVENRLQRVDALPAVSTYALLVEGDDLWIGADDGVLHFAAGTLQRIGLPSDEAPATVNALARAQGRFWAGTSRGLFQLQGVTWQRPARIGADIGPVEAMLADRDGNFWVAANEALLRLRDAQLSERIEGRDPGAHRAVRALLEDREGNLWLGSQWQGVARLWNGWTHRYGIAEGLADPLVWSIARDPDGRLWVGGNEGLSVFDGERFDTVLDASELPHPNAYTLLAEVDALWIGTRRGLARLSGNVLDTPTQFDAIANLQVNGIHRDRSGSLWIATSGGLYRSDAAGLFHYGLASGLQDLRTRLLLERSDGSLLLGTQHGLYEVHGDTLRRVGTDLGLPEDLDVTALHELPDGNLLLGTLSERVFQFDGHGWFEYRPAHGLPANSPFFITHDRHGWIWVAGIRGVYRVRRAELDALRAGDLAQVQAEFLLSERGDQRGSQKGYCCNGAGNAKGFIQGDRLWLPTRDGVVTLRSGEIHANPVVPPVAIERVRVAGRWRNVSNDAALALEPGQRDIAFEFTVLSFQQPASVGLRYRLIGYDENWRVPQEPTRRDAIYTNLPPGDYRFEVSGANNALRWNPQPAAIPFRIEPYLHERPLFQVLLAAALVGLGFGLQALRSRKLHRRQQALEQLVTERTAELASVNQRLQAASHTDALTGLRNRRFLHGQLPADLSFYVREMRKAGNEGMVMMLALVDIDHFKSINDRHGHRAGDRVLEQFARVLERQVRSGDYVVRWGGEEFLLVLRPMPAQETAKIAERIRSAILAQPFEIDTGETLALTASIGFLEYPLFRDIARLPDWEPMVDIADRALYVIKSSGRNGWATLRPTSPMTLEALTEELRAGVAHAIEHGRVQLVRSAPEPIDGPADPHP